MNIMEAGDPEEWYTGIEMDLWKGSYKAHKWDEIRKLNPECQGHPAKMANGLLERILKFLMSEGILKFGDTVLDPMAGVGTTAIGWIMMNPEQNRAITVELEPKFIEFQKKNKALLESKLQRKVNWTIIQGDARRLEKLLVERDLVSVTSPPYVTQSGGTNPSKEGVLADKALMKRHSAGNLSAKGYGDSEGNIGNLEDTPVAVTSPPYADSVSETRTQDGGEATTDGEGRDGTPSKQESTMSSGMSANSVAKPDLKERTRPLTGPSETPHTESYLEAMQTVFNEVSKVCRCIVTVTKNPTRDKKLRRLDLDMLALLHMTGFKVTHWFHAQLFKVVHQATLDGDVKKEAKGRLSFFKRMFFQKGNIVADHEDVIVAQR